MNTLNNYIVEYLEYCECRKRLDKKTLKAYQIDLKQYLDFSSNSSEILSKNTVDLFITKLHRQYKPKTIKRKIASLKAFFHYLEYKELLEENPFAKLDLHFREAKTLPKTIPFHSIQKFLSTMYSQKSQAFDKDSLWHSWIDNPMNIAKEIDICNDSFETDFLEAFSLIKSTLTDSCIRTFKERIIEIKEKYREVDIQCEDLIEKLIAVDKFTINSPYYRDKVAYFLSGFETFELWKAIIQSFLYTGKYLWIYGRKNMKLFGGNFNELFEYLDKKAIEPSMAGIDFKVLFLDPAADEVHYAHKDQDIFEPELRATIARAKRTIGSNIYVFHFLLPVLQQQMTSH